MKLIVNADDFGLTRGFNRGIIDAHQNGIVMSTTMMANMDEVEDAAELAKQNPQLGVGVHFCITQGKPLTKGLKTLVDSNGYFFDDKFLRNRKIDSLEIEQEFHSQIERFCTLELKPTHFDSHHHVHFWNNIYPMFEKVAIEYGLPIRRPETNLPIKVRTTEHFIGEFFGDHITEDTLVQLLQNANHYQTVEVMSHPAFCDVVPQPGGYDIQRENDRKILTNAKIKDTVKQLQIELVNFSEI